jgi:hypothetical protein
MIPKRRALRQTLGVLISLAICARAYWAVVPRGVPFLPFLLVSVEGPVLTSPDGKRSIQVYFNDAGAAHHGPHWTWFTENSWLLGRKVICEGKVGPQIAVWEGVIPVSWTPDMELVVDFEAAMDF